VRRGKKGSRGECSRPRKDLGEQRTRANTYKEELSQPTMINRLGEIGKKNRRRTWHLLKRKERADREKRRGLGGTCCRRATPQLGGTRCKSSAITIKGGTGSKRLGTLHGEPKIGRGEEKGSRGLS